MNRWIILALLIGCGDNMTMPPSPGGIDPGPSCSELGTGDGISCFDFNSGLAAEWAPEAGEWFVSNGAYIGHAATLGGAPCQASEMVVSMLQGFEARNLRIALDMTAFDRADKFVVLRGLDPNNRIEINFRARFTEASPGDLVVQEINDCVQNLHTQWFEVSLPHEVEHPIHAEITLIDDNLTVVVDGNTVISGHYPLTDRSGRVGLGVIDEGTVVFDSILIEKLDPAP
jgi:hypothetical protein